MLEDGASTCGCTEATTTQQRPLRAPHPHTDCRPAPPPPPFVPTYRAVLDVRTGAAALILYLPVVLCTHMDHNRNLTVNSVIYLTTFFGPPDTFSVIYISQHEDARVVGHFADISARSIRLSRHSARTLPSIHEIRQTHDLRLSSLPHFSLHLSIQIILTRHDNLTLKKESGE